MVCFSCRGDNVDVAEGMISYSFLCWISHFTLVVMIVVVYWTDRNAPTTAALCINGHKKNTPGSLCNPTIQITQVWTERKVSDGRLGN
jgi:hypothetical protein